MSSDAGPPMRRRPRARRVARGVTVLALGLLAGELRAQEKPGGPPGPGEPSPRSQPRRPPTRVVGPPGLGGQPAAFDSSRTGLHTPRPRPANPAPATWSFSAAGRANLGYDTNVFQADSATGDAFSEVGGTAILSRNDGRGLLRARVDLERRFYRRFSRADELTGLADLTGARQLGPLRAGAVLGASYLDLRVLDREGNLLSRSNFASFSSRALGFGDLRVTRELYLSTETSYRWKNYEETTELTSLDYGEWLAKLAVTQYLPARISIRLQGGIGQRDYSDLRAADSSGSVTTGNPRLELHRLEGEGRLRKRWGERGYAQATVGLRRSDDLFQDELSADQRSGSFEVRHGAGGWLIDLYGGVVRRDYDLRRSGGGGVLEEEYVSVEADVQRDLWQGARLSGGYELFRRSANDVRGDYTVGTWQLGLVHAF